MRILRLLTPLMLLSVLLIPAQLAPPRAAHAAGFATIQVTPNTVLAGSGAPVAVSGTGYYPGAVIRVWLDSALGSYYIGATTADAVGAFGLGGVTAAVRFQAPARSEAYIVRAVDVARNVTASAWLYAVNLTLSSSAAPAGAQISVSGANFQALQPLTVQLGGVIVLATTTDATGAFPPQFFTVPVSLGMGPQPLLVRNGVGGSAIAVTTTFTILSLPNPQTLSLTPSSVSAGSLFTVNGSYYPALATLQVWLDGTFLGSITTNAYGALIPAQFMAPSTVSVGAHTLYVRDWTGRALASATLTVLPAPVTASGCVIFAAMPAQAGSGPYPPRINSFYLAVNDPYAPQYGAVNNQASLALDPGITFNRPGFTAVVQSASCGTGTATVNLIVVSGNGVTFRVGDPMTITLNQSYGTSMAIINDTATHHVVNLALTTMVIIP